MKLEFVSSINYNQTLVVSVFLHLLFMTIILFLPAPVIREQVITPAFLVDLVSLPSEATSIAPQPAAVLPESVAEKKQTPSPKPVKVEAPAIEVPPVRKTVEAPRAKTEKAPVARKIAQELEQLQAKLPPPPSLLEELDQVARLAPKVTAKKQKKNILENTLRDQEKKHPPKASLEKKAIAPPVRENVEEVLSRDPVEEKERVPAGRPEPDLKELEFAAPVPQPRDLDKATVGKSAAALLKEFERIEDLQALAKKRSSAKVAESKVPIEGKVKADEAFAPIREKLSSLSPAPVKVDKGKPRENRPEKEFKSGLRKLAIPVKVPGKGKDASSSVDVVTDGQIGADLLSLYIGEIYKRVYEKWRQPIGAKSEDAELNAAFYIFPKGNIDTPIVQKSSGDEKLDSLGIRAILDAEPFPPFPEGFKVSNLHVSIHFKYIPGNH